MKALSLLRLSLTRKCPSTMLNFSSTCCTVLGVMGAWQRSALRPSVGEGEGGREGGREKRGREVGEGVGEGEGVREGETDVLGREQEKNSYWGGTGIVSHQCYNILGWGQDIIPVLGGGGGGGEYELVSLP